MDLINSILGLGVQPSDLDWSQVSARAVVIFIAAIAMVRTADKRFLSKMTALDAILGFLLASMLARAINGSAPFFPTIAGGFVLVLLHRLACKLAARSRTFGALVKGHEDLLIKDGRVLHEAMAANDLTEKDLLEELRQHGHVASPQEVKQAYIERSGKISVIPREP